MVSTYITVHVITMYSMVDTVLGEISQVVEKQAPLQLTRMFPLQLAIDSRERANVGLLLAWTWLVIRYSSFRCLFNNMKV